MCDRTRVEVANSGMVRNRTEPTCIKLSGVDSEEDDLHSRAGQEG